MGILTEAQIQEAAGRLSADPSASIRGLSAEYGVNESSLRRALKRRELNPERDRSTPEDDGVVELPVFVRDYRQFDKIKVYPIGDLHIGSPYHAGTKLDEWLGYIEETPNATLLDTGDNINAAMIGSPSDVYGEKMTAGKAIKLVESKFAPIADAGRLDVLTGGNHEARIYRLTGIDIMEVVAANLEVNHYEGAAAIVYLVGDEEYVFMVRHGTGNAPASMNAITRAGYVMTADVHVTGHTHRQSLVMEDTFLPPTAADPVARRHTTRYVTSGSFLWYERYAAERGYAPSHLGAPRIHLDGTRHDVHVSL